MGLSSSVWERGYTGSNEMSKNLYALMICFWTALGVFSSAWASTVTTHLHLNWMHFIGILVVSMLGVFISVKSDNPVVSLLGYAMITIPFGLMMGPLVAMYTKASVVNVLFVTTGIVVVLGLIGAIIPQSLESWGSYLFAGLVALLIGHLAIPFAAMMGLPVREFMTAWDWIGVALFSAYVVYDLNRAMQLERTHDNAIDSAVAIYLDFANLFIRLLQLTGRKSDD